MNVRTHWLTSWVFDEPDTWQGEVVHGLMIMAFAPVYLAAQFLDRHQ